MNRKQEESLAKYSYDLSKIILTMVVIGKLFHPEIPNWVFISGCIATILTLLLGYLLEEGRNND